jgi:hypothetical protein
MINEKPGSRPLDTQKKKHQLPEEVALVPDLLIPAFRRAGFVVSREEAEIYF